jgi:alpha-tubulin suppressor-like RCC1 family protein/serine/threonine protein kinase
VTVLAPQMLTSLTPSAVFTSSSSAVVLTVGGSGFGPAGGSVTLGRIGAFTAGLNFSVVSDSVVTVRVDVGGVLSVASSAAMDVEFFVNGVLFRSGSDRSRLRVTTAIAHVTPSTVYTGTAGRMTLVSAEEVGIQSCSMGQYHSCAVMVGGTLLCWGSYSNGKLGTAYGAQTPSLPVSGFPDPVMFVSTGAQHTCVITVIRDALCLGLNTYGQLGDGTFASSSKPVLVRGGYSWLHLHASEHITCGVTTSGTVFCWGRDETGQCGSGAIVSAARPVPNAVVSLKSGFRYVACAFWTCCALRADGQLLCWGSGSNGERGVDTTVGSGTPARILLPSGVQSNFISIAAGYYHFCSISASSQVWCWGDNQYSQTGTQSSVATKFLSPVLVANAPAAASIVTAGAGHSCAGNASVLICWGSNLYGQLGDGSAPTDSRSPSKVLLPLYASERIVSVSSNRGWSTCAVSSFNRIFVWGYSGSSNLGFTSTDLTPPNQFIPVSILLPEIKSFTIGSGSQFDSLSWADRSTFVAQFHQRSFVAPSNGSLTCSFALGPFSFESGNALSQVTVLAPQMLTSLTPSAVFTSSSSAVVLTVGGSGFGPAGGSVTLGRIGAFTAGLNFSVVSDSVVTVRVDVGGVLSVASSAAMDVEFFVNGVLFRSGSDRSRLRVTTAIAHVTPSTVYTGTAGRLTFVAGEDFGVQSCSASSYHTCAVMVGGTLFCWGDASAGRGSQLGSAAGSIKPSVPVSGFPNPVVFVSASTEHTCIITSIRDAFCMGINTYGQLGDGTFLHSSNPVRVLGGYNWLQLHASFHITCGVTLAGAVYCWGRDQRGQGGSGAIVTTYRPIPSAVVTLNSGFQSVVCSTWACCALRVDGELFCWGDSTFGELGLNTKVGSGSPERIVLNDGSDSKFLTVSPGWSNFCAISINFLVWCWGDNEYSQCGTQISVATSMLLTPTLVLGTPLNSTILTTGSIHSCAGNASVLMCWGSNMNSQLGDGSATADSRPPSLVLFPLAASERIVSVSSNRGWSTCAVSSLKRMFTWGANNLNQLGDGGTKNRAIPVPLILPETRSIIIGNIFATIFNSDRTTQLPFDSLSWADRSTFVVQFHQRSFVAPSNGSLTCSFALGPFSFESGNALSQVTVLAPQMLTSLTPSAVFTSSSSAVVLTVGGSGFGPAGGSVTLGRIGAFTAGLNFSVVSDSVVTVRVDVGGVLSVASSAAMDVEFFVNGVLFRSGSDRSRLRVTTAIAHVTPSTVYTGTAGRLTFVAGEDFGVQSCSAGQFHTCAVMVGGTLFCWGVGDTSSNRPGSAVGSAAGSITLSVPVSGIPGAVIFVSVGTWHTCVITAKRDAFCMGNNDNGQLGDGTLLSSSTPVLVLGGFKWLHLYSSQDFSCGVTTTGAVYFWGKDIFGVGGSGFVFIDEPRFRLAPYLVLSLGNGVRFVTCTVSSCCALRVDAQLWCWGDSLSGQRGVGSTIESGTPARVYIPGSAQSNFSHVAAGSNHYCAISSNFEVYCWGDNKYSQTGTQSSVSTKFLSPVLVANAPAAASIVTAGAGHSCAGNASVLICWGSNSYGQLGDGSLTTDNRSPSKVLLPLYASEQIVSVSSNRGWSTCAVSSFNRIFVWGYNGAFNLGDGFDINRVVPVSGVLLHRALVIGSGSQFDSLSWADRSTFVVQFHQRSFVAPSNGSLTCSFALGPFSFESGNALSQVTVLAPQMLTSLTPSAVFTSSSSAVVLTVGGSGFGPAGGSVTLGRIGAFTAGLNFSVVSDSVVTVRVDVGGVLSVASSAAMDVEFFVNGVLFRSSSEESRLSVAESLQRLFPQELFAHNLRGGVFLTIFGNQFGPAGGNVTEGRIGLLSHDLMFSVASLSISSLSETKFIGNSQTGPSKFREVSDSTVVLVAIRPFSNLAEQLLGRPLSVQFSVNSRRFRTGTSSPIAVLLQIRNVLPTSIYASRASVLILQVDSFGQLQNNMSNCVEVMIGAVILASPCVWITNTTVRVSVSANDIVPYSAVSQSLQFWDGSKIFKSTPNSGVLILPYQEPNPPSAEADFPFVYVYAFGISFGVLLIASVFFAVKQWQARLRLKMIIESRNDSSYDCKVRLIQPRELKFAEQEDLRDGCFGNIRKAVWNAAPGLDIAVAVKQQNKISQCQKWDMIQFEKEVQEWASHQHANCIKVLGYCTQLENIFIVMEWVQNGSLADALKDEKAVPPHARLRMARELSEGLNFLHERKIAHGSIKNRNILITQDGTAKFGDRIFTELQRGCTAQLPDSSAVDVSIDMTDTGTDVMVESLAFLSPDILAENRHLDFYRIVTGSRARFQIDSLNELAPNDAFFSAPADVFAFGVVMWSLLAWKKPLDGMNEDEIKDCIIDGTSLPTISPLPKGISFDYVDLMTKCLQKDPALRPTADTVSSRLRAIDPSTRPAQPIDLVPPGFISDKSTLLDCVLVAMPNECHKLEIMIAKIAKFHSTDADAIRTIEDYGLSPLEAQSISFYTFSADNGFEWHESPFMIYNRAVRTLDFNVIASWKHFSFFFISGLNKLPCVECDVYRGLDLRLTQMSHLYQKDGLVCKLIELFVDAV